MATRSRSKRQAQLYLEELEPRDVPSYLMSDYTGPWTNAGVRTGTGVAFSRTFPGVLTRTAGPITLQPVPPTEITIMSNQDYQLLFAKFPGFKWDKYTGQGSLANNTVRIKDYEAIVDTDGRLGANIGIAYTGVSPSPNNVDWIQFIHQSIA